MNPPTSVSESDIGPEKHQLPDPQPQHTNVKKRKPSNASATQNSNRKNAQATRTLRACELCRKQKTRCFKVNETSNTCLRCTFLNKPCSFGNEAGSGTSGGPGAGVSNVVNNSAATGASGGVGAAAGTAGLNNATLTSIHKGVKEILKILKSSKSAHNKDVKSLLEAANNNTNSDESTFIPTTNPNIIFNHGQPNFGHMLDLDLAGEDIEGDEDEGDDEGDDVDVNDPLGASINDKLVTNPIDLENQTSFKSPTNSLEVSPIKLIENQITNRDLLPKNIENLLNKSAGMKHPNMGIDTSRNIITLNILTMSETINLMNDFRRNYGRWISFPLSLPTEILIERLINKSPLLLTTCCCLSLRYLFNNTNPGDINNLIRKRITFCYLIKQLVVEINSAFMKINLFKKFMGDIELLQSLVILSIYSNSLTSIILSNTQALSNNQHRSGSHNNGDDLDYLNIMMNDELFNLNDINLDPWYLSGMGLTIFISKTTFGELINTFTNNNLNSKIMLTVLYDEELDSNEYQILTIMRIYNHLVLVHLINCVFSGRMCLVDEIRLNYCNITLGLPSSTNFDGRMVSEISILLITYNFIQMNLNINNLTISELNVNYKSTLAEINHWYNQWEYLFQQPALQFVEVCYNFCNMLIIYIYHYKQYLINNNLANLSNADIPAMGNGGNIGGGVSGGGNIGDFFNQDNIKFILQQMDVANLKNFLRYGNNLLNFIKLINNNSYFAYLSDQLHFCFYFTSVVLIKYLSMFDHHPSSNDQEGEIENVYLANLRVKKLFNQNDKVSILSNVRLLITKFNNINNNNMIDNDIISKYKLGLRYNLNMHFPEYQ